MRKALSILCSFAFALSGVMMAITASDPSPVNSYKTMSAATMQRTFSLPEIDTNFVATLPVDVSLDLLKRQGVSVTKENTDSVLVDSLFKRIMDLEQTRQVTKVKWRKVPVPTPVVQIDTVHVPVYYLATQVGNKEGPTGECISVYEVHKVDEICTEITNSYVEGTNEYHIAGGD